MSAEKNNMSLDNVEKQPGHPYLANISTATGNIFFTLHFLRMDPC
jgi:hypothetical protein